MTENEEFGGFWTVRWSHLRTLRSIFPKCICQELSGHWSEKRTRHFDLDFGSFTEETCRNHPSVVSACSDWSHLCNNTLTSRSCLPDDPVASDALSLHISTQRNSSCCVSITTAADFELVASRSALLTPSFLNPLHLHCTERWLQVFNLKLRLRFCVLGPFGLDYCSLQQSATCTSHTDFQAQEITRSL